MDHHIQQKSGRSSCVRLVFSALLLLGLAACAGEKTASVQPSPRGSGDPLAGAYYKVGKPYQIGGTWYYPQEDDDYVETGVASWYGPGFHGRKTANNELYDQTAMTAAHRTLPLPSVVRVTNLRNGRSIVLRVNDRGPFAKNRIIDVSQTAAKELGFLTDGTAPVRVEILPSESRLAVSRLKEPELAAPPAVPVATVEAQSLDAPAAAPQATVSAGPQYADLAVEQRAAVDAAVNTGGTAVGTAVGTVTQGAPEASDIYVQAGAFSAIHNAERLRARISSIGPTLISEKKTGSTYLFRVRVGPVASLEEADRITTILQANDINDAHIVFDKPAS